MSAKKYIWIVILSIIIVICFPFILNEIMMCDQVRAYVGEGKDWLSFWGGYIGAIISSATAFVILWITYNQNRRENERNREQHNNQIQYQQEKDRFWEFKKACVEYSKIFDINELIALIAEIECNSNKAALTIKQLLTESGNKQIAATFFFSNVCDRPKNELCFIRKFNDYEDAFGSVVMDLQEVNHQNNKLSNNNDLVAIYQKIKTENKNKISEAFDKYLFEATTSGGSIDFSSVLREYVLRYIQHMKIFQTCMQEYFKFEETRINNIIKIDDK